MQPIFFGPSSVLQAKLSDEINFFGSLLPHSWDLGPAGSDLRLFPENSTHSEGEE